MPDVEIVYRARVEGAEQVRALADRTRQLDNETKRVQSEVTDFNRAMFNLNDTNKKVEDSTRRVTEETKKHKSALAQSTSEIKSFRREMFTVSLILGTTIGVFRGFLAASDSGTGILEDLGTSTKRLAAAIGDSLSASLAGSANALTAWIDKITEAIQASKNLQQTITSVSLAGPAGVGQGIVRGTAQALGFTLPTSKEEEESKLLALKQESLRTEKLKEDFAIQIARSEGDTVKALELQIEQKKRIAATEIASKKQREEILGLIDKAGKAELDALRRAELGIRSIKQIHKEFARDIVSSFEHLASDPLFKMLQGERQSFQDIFKGFTTSINRAFSDLIGKSFVASIFGGGNFFDIIKENFETLKGTLSGKNATVTATEKVAKTASDIDTKIEELKNLMARAQACMCRTADNTAFIGNNLGRAGGMSGITGITAEITGGGGGGGWLSSIGKIAGAVSSIGSLFSGGVNIGGSASAAVSQGLSAIPTASQLEAAGAFFKTSHAGGPARFQMGGEVPAFLHPNEYVVKASAAMANKDLLRDINEGDTKRSRKANNVFLIKTNDAQSFSDMLGSPSSQAKLEIEIMRAIMRNGDIRRIIRDFA